MSDQDVRDLLDSDSVDRRQVLRGAAGVGTLGIAGLAGCSGGDGGDGGSGDSGDGSSGDGSSGDGGDGGSGDGQQWNDTELLVLHSWGGGDGAAAVADLKEVFNEKYPDMPKSIRTVSGTGNQNLNTVIAKRLQNKNPPGSFGAWPGKYLGKFEGQLADGEEDVWEAANLKEEHADEVVAASHYNGKWSSVPLGSHRMNDLFYNPKVLDEAGVDPESIDSPNALNDAMATVAENTDVEAPMGHAMKATWPSVALFAAIMLGQEGYDAYMNYIDGKGDKAAVRRTLETQKEMQSNYITDDASTLDFTQVAKKLLNGDVAFQHQGNWVAGTFRGEDATYNEDWGATTFPGHGNMYGFHLDSFLYPANNPTPEKTKLWLQFVGSEEAQIAFNRLKGSIPTRKEVPTDRFGDYLTETIKEFKNADKRPPTLTFGLAVEPQKQTAVYDAMSENMTGPYDVETGADALMKAVE